MNWGLWGRGERGDGAEVPAERRGGWRCRVQGRRCTCTSRMLWARAWREKHVCVQACGAPSGMAGVDGRAPSRLRQGWHQYVAAEPAAGTVAETVCVPCSTSTCAVQDSLRFLLSFYSSSQHLPFFHCPLFSTPASSRAQARPACRSGVFPKSQNPLSSFMKCGDLHPPGLCSLQVSPGWSFPDSDIRVGCPGEGRDSWLAWREQERKADVYLE